MRKHKKSSRLSSPISANPAGAVHAETGFQGLDPLETRLLMSTTEDLRLLGPSGAAGDQFGQSVNADGDFLIVGAPGRNSGGVSNSGAAYIYQRNGNALTLVATLTANDGTDGDLFGSSVAISGDRAIIGATGDNAGAGVNSGSAYIFQRSGNTWAQVAKLIANDSGAADMFGASVSISGGRAIVGAAKDDASNSGSAYFFHDSGGNVWTQVSKVSGDNIGGAEFGHSVDIDGDSAVIGAFGETNGVGTAAGAAYVYTFNGASWVQQDKLLATGQAAFDQLGSAVAIDGNRVVVGSVGDDDGGSGSGSAYIFERSGSNWNQSAKIIAPDDLGGDQFGNSVDVNGDFVIVGAKDNDSPSSVQNVGSAYLFQKVGSNWTNKANLTASDAAADDGLGFTVGLSDAFAFAGAAFNDIGANANAGATYVYDINSSAPAVVTAGVVSGLLTVTGTNSADTITLSAQGNGRVRVQGNGINSIFIGVNNITIDALGGNDTITVGPNIRDTLGNLINVTINGGDGNDSITGGDGNDLINGGEGDDSITGGFGNDNINSGGGNDIAVGGGGSDIVDGVATGPQVAVGVGGAKKVTYTDADGTIVTVTASKALANLTFTGDNIVMTNTASGVVVTGTNVAVSSIALLNSTKASSLSITTKAGDTVATIGEITGSDPFGTIKGSKVDLNGAGVVFTDDGTASSITLRNLTNGADIVLPGSASLGTAITLNSAGAGSDITLGGALKSLKAVGDLLGNMSATWFGGISTKGDIGGTLTASGQSASGVSFSGITGQSLINLNVSAPGVVTSIKGEEWTDGSLTAGALGSVTIAGKPANSTTGDFGADVTLTNAAAAQSLKSAKISGMLDESDWDLASHAGTITAGKIGDNFELDVDGIVKSISAGEWIDGALNAEALGTLTIAGKAANGSTGNFGANLNLTDATATQSLKTAKISGILDDATWILASKAGSITAGSIGDDFSLDVDGLLASLTSNGNVAGDFAADSFTKVTVKGDLNAARFLAGADFGADGTLDGSGDTYGTGTIGSFSVNGAINDSVIGAGLDPVDGIFKNGNDAIVGGILSSIKSLSLKGLMNDASLIAAGKFPTSVKVANVVVDPTTDPRFLVG